MRHHASGGAASAHGDEGRGLDRAVVDREAKLPRGAFGLEQLESEHGA